MKASRWLPLAALLTGLAGPDPAAATDNKTPAEVQKSLQERMRRLGQSHFAPSTLATRPTERAAPPAVEPRQSAAPPPVAPRQTAAAPTEAPAVAPRRFQPADAASASTTSTAPSGNAYDSLAGVQLLPERHYEPARPATDLWGRQGQPAATVPTYGAPPRVPQNEQGQSTVTPLAGDDPRRVQAAPTATNIYGVPHQAPPSEAPVQRFTVEPGRVVAPAATPAPGGDAHYRLIPQPPQAVPPAPDHMQRYRVEGSRVVPAETPQHKSNTKHGK